MANSVLNVTYKTKKTGSGTQDLTKELKQTGLSITDLKSGIDLAIGSFKMIVAAAQALINPTIEAAGEVRNLQRIIGGTAEESSKLIQAADDMGISAGTLQGAMEAAIKRGVEPTIEGIGALADEYNAIESPIARTKFLMDKFGKSGADLGPLMEKGAAGIKQLGDEAVNTGLVLSQDAVDAAREFELSVDALGDASAGYFSLLAQQGIPILTGLNNLLAEGITLTNQLEVARRAGILTDREAASVSEAVKWGYFDVGTAAEYVQDKTDKVAAATEAAADRYQGLADAADAANKAMASDAAAGRYEGIAEALGVVGEANFQLSEKIDGAAAAASRLNAVLAGAVGNELRSYEESQADIEQQIADTRAELEKYTRMNGQVVVKETDTTRASQNLTIALAEQQTAAGSLSEAQQKLAENTDPDKQLQLEAAVARAQQSLSGAQGEVGEWNAALAESGGTYVTDYTTKINEITGELYTLEDAAAANAKAHEDATERILFGYIQQALAVDGLTLEEIHALTSVGEQWGILDSDTATAVDGILAAAEDLAKGGHMADFENQVNRVHDAILGVPTDWTTTFHVNQDGQVPTYTQNGGNANAFADGVTDFVVPPGYPNDSFPMFVQSGEVVNVTPAGRSSSGGSSDTYNVTINAPGATANELYAMLQANDIRRRTGARS